MNARRLRALALGIALAAAPPLAAQQAAEEAGTPRTVERQWLWGAGRASVLDTYLTPLTTCGPDFSIDHRTRRLFRPERRMGKERWHVHAHYAAHLAYTRPAPSTANDRLWDAELTATAAIVRRWPLGHGFAIYCGPALTFSGGGTYDTRSGNNPAQGRAAIALAAAGGAEWKFRIARRTAEVRIDAEAPLAGLCFAPQYGQSYYEIFSLGHTSGIIRFTQPANAPTASLLCTAALPLGRSRITLGYQADVRQSRLGGLKRHAWRNAFMLGFTRTLRVI